MAINPAYWGSLLSLLIGVILTIFLSINGSVPSHVELSLDGVAHGFPLLITVQAIMSIRSYIAVSANTYGGNPDSFLAFKSKYARLIAFFLNGFLILLSNICLIVSTGFSVYYGLMLSVLMLLVSLLLAFMWFGAEAISPEESYEVFNAKFRFSDVFLLLPTFVASQYVDTFILVPMLWATLFFSIVIFGYELRAGYCQLIIKQFYDTWNTLDNTSSNEKTFF